MANKTDLFADDWNSQENLIKRLQEKTKVLQTDRITAAFTAVDRKDFMRDKYRVEAYEDYAVPIGEDQTISQPTTVAYMLELLAPEPGDSVLDVGCGSGWTTALLAELVGNQGQVVGLEINEKLANFGQQNLQQYDFPQATIRQQDASKQPAEEAPFDRILVSAAAEEIPDILLGQLKKEGVMVIPVKEDIIVATKTETGKLEEETHPGFRFVPFRTEKEA